MIELGDGADNIVTVVYDKTDHQFPRIYVDSNNDEDLTNDGPGLCDSDRGRLTVEVKCENWVVPYVFVLSPYADVDRDHICYYRSSCRTGELSISEGTYRIAILDANSDGRFDDVNRGILFVDLNQDGRFECDSDSAEFYLLGKPFNILGTVRKVASLSPNGEVLRLRLSDAPVAMKRYLEPGQPAPAFSGEDLEGNLIDLASEAAGAKYLLLHFWHSPLACTVHGQRGFFVSPSTEREIQKSRATDYRDQPGL